MKCSVTAAPSAAASVSAFCLACCIAANIVVTPLYMGAPRETVIGMIVPVLLPFNALKIAINCVATALVYKPLSKALQD